MPNRIYFTYAYIYLVRHRRVFRTKSGGKMKNTKLLIIASALLASLFLIIGCSDNELPPAPDSSGSSDTTTAPASTDETGSDETTAPAAPADSEYEDLKYGDKRLSVKHISVHDPSIVYDNTTGRYYLFGSHRAWAASNDLASWNTIQVPSLESASSYNKIFKSNIEWSALGGTQGNAKYDVTGNMWAPDVIYNEKMGKWCMYMSINGDNFYSSIALLTSDKINGKYEYAGTIVYSGFTSKKQAEMTDFVTVTGKTALSKYAPNNRWDSTYGPNAIDPCVLYDKNGDLWMSYGSWFGGIFLLKLDNETGLRDMSYEYKTKANVSDQYFGYRICGGYGGTGEGSYIVWDKDTGYYYLYVSYCGLSAASENFNGYHIRLFRSEDITGPYVDAAGHNAVLKKADGQENLGVKLFGNYALSGNKGNGNASNGYKSGGHNSAFIDSDGQRYLIYHTRFNTDNEWHEARVHQQFVNEDGWLVTAVYEHQGSVISKDGYAVDDIVGEYEYVDHGLSNATSLTGTKMLKTQKVTLNADGTISGDVSGTWDQHKGSDGNGYYVTMQIGKATYKGVFFKQYDETSKHAETMTFTLIGDNNHSVWGSKVG